MMNLLDKRGPIISSSSDLGGLTELYLLSLVRFWLSFKNENNLLNLRT